VNRLALIVPAAGSGSRLGEVIPKPYLKIAGKTILEHTLSAFKPVKGLSEVVVSTSEFYAEQTRNLLNHLYPDIKTTVVEGGSERQDSVWNAIRCISDGAHLVMIHDSVRPFVKAAQIEECVQVALEPDVSGALLAIPSKDTVKIVDRGVVESTPDRSRLWMAQTPQVFKRKDLIEAYENAGKYNIEGTDDASLLEAAGRRVKVVRGSHDNFKITWPLDLIIAKHLLT
jgi:2-C-methyl-D-erythritol 4-phosphate cytidylyltransferase